MYLLKNGWYWTCPRRAAVSLMIAPFSDLPPYMIFVFRRSLSAAPMKGHAQEPWRINQIRFFKSLILPLGSNPNDLFDHTHENNRKKNKDEVTSRGCTK